MQGLCCRPCSDGQRGAGLSGRVLMGGMRELLLKDH